MNILVHCYNSSNCFRNTFHVQVDDDRFEELVHACTHPSHRVRIQQDMPAYRVLDYCLDDGDPCFRLVEAVPLH